MNKAKVIFYDQYTLKGHELNLYCIKKLPAYELLHRAFLSRAILTCIPPLHGKYHLKFPFWLLDYFPKHIIINFRDKTALFYSLANLTKMMFLILMTKMSWYVMMCHEMAWYAILSYRYIANPFYTWTLANQLIDSQYFLSIPLCSIDSQSLAILFSW